ncbi:MAG: hypothetical protein IPJ40_19655 [Saprospirales bacterium]|nr:hypothetical protein [Saprospirales bacterium]
MWDRGHPPAKTEIHPARFVATQRHLLYKIKMPNNSEYYSTRCDVYANGEGSAIWNNKNYLNFSQSVDMSEKNYSVVFRHTVPKPTPNSKLKYFVKPMSGLSDTYLGEPIIEVLENGTPSYPDTPCIKLTLPWKSNDVSNLAYFSRSVFIYWDEPTSNGVPQDYIVGEYIINLKNIKIISNLDGISKKGEIRLLSNVGSDWIFLNELVTDRNILSSGIGSAKKGDIFLINKTFTIPIRVGDEFRIVIGGWEADELDNLFGHIINPYGSCDEVMKRVASAFNSNANKFNLVNKGGDDEVDKFLQNIIINSIGPYRRCDKILLSDKEESSQLEVDLITYINRFNEKPDPCAELYKKYLELKAQVESSEAVLETMIKQSIYYENGLSKYRYSPAKLRKDWKERNKGLLKNRDKAKGDYENCTHVNKC